jgi:D-alanine transaminase
VSTVYLNGQFLPIDQASISVLDRGFLFGDGVYEVIPAYGGHLFRLEEHLQRLQNSLQGIQLTNPLSKQQWIDVLNQLLQKNDGEDQSVYLQVTRGVAAKRDHVFPDEIHATVFIMCSELNSARREDLQPGVSAITLDDIRWRACDIKATSLLANIMLRQQAKDEGAVEAILIRDGMATEGAASNIFIVSKGILLTPPKSHFLLPGITRDLVLDLARENNIACEERDISEAELRNASEIWMTSSTKEVVPIVELDGKSVGNGQYGSIWDAMIDIYQACKSRLRQGEA